MHSLLTWLKRPRNLVLALLVLLPVGAGACYLILLNPSSIFVRWAQAAAPEQITMISLGPYPEEKDFQLMKKEGVKYIISTLDERMPYEKVLIEREEALARKYGMTVKVFPMASLFDHEVFDDYREQMNKAVAFLKRLDAPAYVHCYLGKHRTIRIRDALAEAGVPERYWKPLATRKEYWEVVNRYRAAKAEFEKNNFARVLEILAPVTTPDPDVAQLRGWSHYRLGLITEATDNFRAGLKQDPTNPRNLLGLGYCYLASAEPVQAQRQFTAVLQQLPEQEAALVGLGLAHLRLLNKAAAAQVFRKVLAMNPANEEVKGYLKQAETP